MTDNIIPKKDAIDRMRDGLPCETQCDKAWDRTFWRDFDDPRATFRIPPEPRREAREWKIEGGVLEKIGTSKYRKLGPKTVEAPAPVVVEMKSVAPTPQRDVSALSVKETVACIEELVAHLVSMIKPASIESFSDDDIAMESLRRMAARRAA